MKTNIYSKLILISVVIFIIVAISRSTTLEKTPNETMKSNKNTDTSIPRFLVNSFPNTDWSKIDPIIYEALSGGPRKDGIPSIDKPKFDALASVKSPDEVQAIVMKSDNTVKVYPYNILVWHEIVNDTVNGVPVSITFCPLCGSAIVYNRTLPDGVTTFGVSGGLVESNMIMYDRASETLWQQSTGKALAGKYFGEQLKLESFQLLTLGDVREKYTNALILSTNTGHRRNYDRAPYSGYNESDSFIFSPSVNDNRYPSKTIFVAFRVDDIPVSVPWLEIKEGEIYKTKVNGEDISLEKKDRELTITDSGNNIIPFYFEMWFSWAVQHQDTGVVFDPSKVK